MKFLSCEVSIELQQQQPSDSGANKSGSDAGAYVLRVSQTLDDDDDDDDDDDAGDAEPPVVVAVAAIAGMSWTTVQGLGHGSNEYDPVLLLYVQPAAQQAHSGTAQTSSLDSRGHAVHAASSQRSMVYGVQWQSCEGESGDDMDRQNVLKQLRTLGELEYVLKLCILETTCGVSCMDLNDEQLEMMLVGRSGGPDQQRLADKAASAARTTSQSQRLIWSPASGTPVSSMQHAGTPESVHSSSGTFRGFVHTSADRQQSTPQSVAADVCHSASEACSSRFEASDSVEVLSRQIDQQLAFGSPVRRDK